MQICGPDHQWDGPTEGGLSRLDGVFYLEFGPVGSQPNLGKLLVDLYDFGLHQVGFTKELGNKP